MNTDTGAIAQFENEQDAADAGYDLLLTPAQAEGLLAMNRHDRRAWAKRAIRSAHLEACVVGTVEILDDDEP